VDSDLHSVAELAAFEGVRRSRALLANIDLYSNVSDERFNSCAAARELEDEEIDRRMHAINMKSWYHHVPVNASN
jgi:hypothetical protein